VKVEHTASETTKEAIQERAETLQGSEDAISAKERHGETTAPTDSCTTPAEGVAKEPVKPDDKVAETAGPDLEQKIADVETVSKGGEGTASNKEEEQMEANENQKLQQVVNDEDMNFESMFGDVNNGGDQTNDLNFDLDLNPDGLGDSNPFGSTGQDATNLELLPGLESYANATGDDFSMLNLPPSTSGDQAGGQGNNSNFELPEIQGDSNFNDLFADGEFNDASLMELDLEDGFFNS
jgi:hypothetical protein